MTCRRDSEYTGQSLQALFKQAVQTLETHIAATEETTGTLRADLLSGRLSTRQIGLMLIQEIESRMHEDAALLKILTTLAANIDVLYQKHQTGQ